ncbi:MAG: hypothetical protein II801_00470 [Bacteroidaceae bacterium]|nr:hypothetical protein [Bacteroidaceae bacterium]
MTKEECMAGLSDDIGEVTPVKESPNIKMLYLEMPVMHTEIAWEQMKKCI